MNLKLLTLIFAIISPVNSVFSQEQEPLNEVFAFPINNDWCSGRVRDVNLWSFLSVSTSLSRGGWTAATTRRLYGSELEISTDIPLNLDLSALEPDTNIILARVDDGIFQNLSRECWSVVGSDFYVTDRNVSSIGYASPLEATAATMNWIDFLKDSGTIDDATIWAFSQSPINNAEYEQFYVIRSEF